LTPRNLPADRPRPGPCTQPGLDRVPPGFQVAGLAWIRTQPESRLKPTRYVFGKWLSYVLHEINFTKKKIFTFTIFRIV